MTVHQCYDSTFFEPSNEDALTSARIIIPALLGIIRPKSIIDVGCGLGAWLSVFRAHGIENILGLDGDYVDRAKLCIPANCFRAVDLSGSSEFGSLTS